MSAGRSNSLPVFRHKPSLPWPSSRSLITRSTGGAKEAAAGAASPGADGGDLRPVRAFTTDSARPGLSKVHPISSSPWIRVDPTAGARRSSPSTKTANRRSTLVAPRISANRIHPALENRTRNSAPAPVWATAVPAIAASSSSSSRQTRKRCGPEGSSGSRNSSVA